MDNLDRDTRSAYEAAATAWAHGPEAVYRHLARALLDATGVDLRGALLLDVGAGTGVLGDLAVAAGARCVESDVAAEMLAHVRTGRTRCGAAADGRRLPFAAATFDVVTAGCSLSHVDDPRRMLAELGRVLRPGGAVLASAFPAVGTAHPVRACVEQVLTEAGYRRAAWYEELADARETLVDTPGALHGLARAAGLRDAVVHEVTVETGIADPAELVAYRLGVAQHAQFLAGLDPATRDHVRAEAVARLGDAPPPLVIDLLVLAATAA